MISKGSLVSKHIKVFGLSSKGRRPKSVKDMVHKLVGSRRDASVLGPILSRLWIRVPHHRRLIGRLRGRWWQGIVPLWEHVHNRRFGRRSPRMTWRKSRSRSRSGRLLERCLQHETCMARPMALDGMSGVLGWEWRWWWRSRTLISNLLAVHAATFIEPFEIPCFSSTKIVHLGGGKHLGRGTCRRGRSALET